MNCGFKTEEDIGALMEEKIIYDNSYAPVE